MALAMNDTEETPRQHPLATNPDRNQPASQHRGRLPNTPCAVSVISFVLGSVFTWGAYRFATTGLQSTGLVHFFVAAWAFFHFAEFAVTAGWNLEKCSVDSFLLENGIHYHLAHGFALAEFFVTSYFFPSFKTYQFISIIGVLVTILGQTVRTLAMIHAASNFSHIVALYKRAGHRLVTTGVYSYFRHPSYAGFFYWGLGTQLLLQNPVSFIIYLIVLWRFFNHRIKYEEIALIKFFGAEYEKYRARVGTMIPFIR